MFLSHTQEQKFVDWYRGKYGDTSRETGTGEIPKVPAEKQREDVKEWVDFLKELLGKDVKKIYTHRGGRKEDYLHLVFNNLFLGYGPTYVEEDGTPAKEHLWIDDVL